MLVMWLVGILQTRILEIKHKIPVFEVIFTKIYLNIPHSEKTADVPYTYPPVLPPPSFLDTNFVAKRGNTLNCSEDSNQGFHGGRSISQPPCYH